MKRIRGLNDLESSLYRELADRRLVEMPEEVESILDQIAANQREFIALAARRLTPWRLREQYRLCKANEPLFAALGIRHVPMWMDESGSLFAWWLRR
jgi:hypothetical protein